MVLTERAVQKVRELTRSRGDRSGLRIELLPGGCCGTYYHFTVDQPRPTDLLIRESDACLLLVPAVYALVRGSRLDYDPHLKPPRFRLLRNPNTPERCACGRSFGQPYPGRATPQCQAYRPMDWDEPGESR
ncbi:MAG: HesB/IscA family protein [Bacillota bacterium]